MIEDKTEFRKLAAIMFTDMVGYSALAQKNEALCLELLEEQRAIIRGVLPRHRGEEIKTMGDGFLVEFPSALAAVRCAVEIQRVMSERNHRGLEERRIQLRIGIHLGDIVRRIDDVVGDGVNIAARIEPLAEPGGICISEDVARQIQNKVDESLVRLGVGELKNIQLPVVIYKLQPASGGGKIPATPERWDPLSTSGKYGRIFLAARIALLMFLLVAALSWWFLTHSKVRSVSEPSLAVLPFVNMSSDKENEFVSDGLTEELINAFAKIPGLHVPSRTSVFSYKNKHEDLIKIGRELKVRHVLEGSIRKAGEQLRISVQLIKVSDGYHLWSETYEKPATNIFMIQSEIAQRVTGALREMVMPVSEVGGLTAIREGID